MISPRLPRMATGRSSLYDEIIPEECQSEQSSEAPILRQTQPSVNLNGFDRFLTICVLILNLLFLELHRAGEARFTTFLTWFVNFHCQSGWLCKLEETLFVLSAALVNVFLLVPILNINLHTPSRSTWRFWLFSSWISLMLLNALTISQTVDSIFRAILGEGIRHWGSHFFLIATIVIFTFLLNLRFLLLYGICSCLTIDEKETLENWEGLNPVAGIRDQERRAKLKEMLNIRKLVERAMYGNVPPDWHMKRSNTFNFLKNATEGVQRFVRRRRLHNMQHLLAEDMPGEITNLPTDDVAQLLDEIMQSRTVLFLRILEQRFLAFWDSISDEPGFFRYSSWMKAAIGFTVLLLVYNCIKAIEIAFDLDQYWEASHNFTLILDQSMNTLQATMNNITTTVDTLSSVADESQTIAVITKELLNLTKSFEETVFSFVPDNVRSSEAYQQAFAMMQISLIRVSQSIQDGNIRENTFVSIFFYVESLIGWIKWACLVGYPLGTMFGFYSLFQVMVQHKHLSMGIAKENHIRTRLVARRRGTTRLEKQENVLGLEKKYPINGSVYFIGVLAGTAVVQQHVLGILFTLAISLCLNVEQFLILLDIGGYLVIIYLVILVVNRLSAFIIGDRLLSQQAFNIHRPWPFFLFLLIFTVIHAVLGFFYALVRALLLFATIVWVISRLDISLFQTNKEWDMGHNSFMSMLLLTHVSKELDESRLRYQTETPLRRDEGQSSLSTLSSTNH